MYSTPQVLGSVAAGDDGKFAKSVTLPAGATGSHTLLASGVDVNGRPRVMTLPIRISAAGEGGGEGSGLPVTGSPIALLVLLGAALITAGGGLVSGAKPGSGVVFR
jgi:hypothetical protein